jgi:hypothetical protein
MKFFSFALFPLLASTALGTNLEDVATLLVRHGVFDINDGVATNIVPAPAPKVLQPHGGSCGPTCPPDDDYTIAEKEKLVPAPAPKLAQPHGGSCGPTCPPDDDDSMIEEKEELVPAPAPKLAQPHGGSCGPTCPPDDDDSMIEEKEELVPVPAPAPKLAQPHGGSCGPTCPPDDDLALDEEEDEVTVVEVPTQAPSNLRQPLSQPHGGSCGPTCPPDDDAVLDEQEKNELTATTAETSVLGTASGGDDPSPSRKNSVLRAEFIINHNHSMTRDEQFFVQKSLLASFHKVHTSKYGLNLVDIQFKSESFIPANIGGGLRAGVNRWYGMLDYIPVRRCHPRNDWTHQNCVVWAALEAWSVEDQLGDATLWPTLHAAWEKKFCKLLQKGPHDIFRDAVQCNIMLKDAEAAAIIEPSIQGIVGETEDLMVEADE